MDLLTRQSNSTTPQRPLNHSLRTIVYQRISIRGLVSGTSEPHSQADQCWSFYIIDVSSTTHSLFSLFIRFQNPLYSQVSLPSSLHLSHSAITNPAVQLHKHISTSLRMPSQDLKAVFDKKPVNFTIKTPTGKWQCTLHGDRAT